MIEKLKDVLEDLPDENRDRTEMSTKDRIHILEITENIYSYQDSENPRIRYIPDEAKSLYYNFDHLNINQLEKLDGVLKDFHEKHQERRWENAGFSIRQARIHANEEFKDLIDEDMNKYKKALQIYTELIARERGFDYDYEFYKKQAQLAKKLALKYIDKPNSEIVKHVKERDSLNDTKVFHTNAPEVVKNSGIILTSTGVDSSFKNLTTGETENLTMPKVRFQNEDFQISGHHIIRTNEPTYLVYVAHNNSEANADIKIDTGGVATNNEYRFDDHSHLGNNKVTNSRRSIGPGDAAALEVLEGKIDNRVNQNITVKPGETKVISAIKTNGYETVTANINGKVQNMGSVEMTGAIVTQSEINKHGSIEAAVNAQLEAGKFVNRGELVGNDLGRATGIYKGSEYIKRNNLILEDDNAKPGKVLAEYIIAATGYHDDSNQSGPAVKDENAEDRRANLGKHSTRNGTNHGNYNTRYRLQPNIINIRNSEKKPSLSFKFKAEAKGGRADQAAFRGSLILYIKDKEGNIIGEPIMRNVCVCFGDEVDLFKDIELGDNIDSLEIDMINTADSTPPYKITALSA